MHRHVVDRDADDRATRRHQDDVVTIVYQERGRNLTALFGDTDADHAYATTALCGIALDRRALPEAGRGDDEQRAIGLGHRRAHELVVAPEPHAHDPGSGTTHGPHCAFVEPHGLTRAGHHENVVLAVGGSDADQLVVVLQLDRDESGLERRVIFVETGLLDPAPTRREEQVPVRLVVTRVDHGLDVFTRLQLQKVDDVGAARLAAGHRHLMRLQSVHPATVRKEQEVRVRRCVDEMEDVVLILEIRAVHAAAAAALRAELVNGHGLDVARRAHGEHKVFVVDEVFDVEVARVVLDARAAGVREVRLDLRELLLDDVAQTLFVAEDRLEFGNGGQQLGLFLQQVDAGQSREPTQR